MGAFSCDESEYFLGLESVFAAMSFTLLTKLNIVLWEQWLVSQRLNLDLAMSWLVRGVPRGRTRCTTVLLARIAPTQ
jgi:hypothetical protein